MTAENLSKLGPSFKNMDDDAMSEFSFLTQESDLQPQENVLDLRVAGIAFDK